jgi:hypothetical protein
MSEYHDEARIMIKELKLSGWDSKSKYKVSETAFIEWGIAGDPYEPRDTGWWVDSNGVGTGRSRTSFHRTSPEHALAEYLQMKAEGRWPE